MPLMPLSLRRRCCPPLARAPQACRVKASHNMAIHILTTEETQVVVHIRLGKCRATAMLRPGEGLHQGLAAPPNGGTAHL